MSSVTGPLNPTPLNGGALAAAVRAGTPTLGTFIGSASPIAAEVCAAAGVDWVLLDLEHGAGGEEQVRDVVPAAGSYGVPTVVRVESGARIRMGRVLDSGAAGTTSRTCSSPPAPCSRSSSTQSTPAAAQTSAASGEAEPMKVPRAGAPDRTAAARAP